MKHYAGIDLSMETSHVCIVDADGRKVAAQSVDSTPDAIAALPEHHGPVERRDRDWLDEAVDRAGPARAGCRYRLY